MTFFVKASDVGLLSSRLPAQDDVIPCRSSDINSSLSLDNGKTPTSQSMDPNSTPEPLSRSNCSAVSPGYNGEDDPASLSDEGLHSSHVSPLHGKQFCPR